MSDLRIPQFALIVVALLAGLTRPAAAQRTVDVSIGARIRVLSQVDTTIWRVGYVSGLEPDTIRLKQCGWCGEETYPLPSLAAIQVSTGPNSAVSFLKGALLGLVTGAAVGYLYAWHQTRLCRGEDLCGLEYMAVPMFGAGGIVLGGAIGVALRRDKWEPLVVR